LMGGTAVVESTEGRGSRFIVTLRFGIAAASEPEPVVPWCRESRLAPIGPDCWWPTTTRSIAK
jgi:hypothetical protein